jgi:hypothetical protein
MADCDGLSPVEDVEKVVRVVGEGGRWRQSG